MTSDAAASAMAHQGYATVWKFPLEKTDVQSVPMSAGAELLCVDMQHSTIMLWARLDPEATMMRRFIAIVGTGNPAPTPEDGAYVGSVFDGPFVWHVFDGGER